MTDFLTKHSGEDVEYEAGGARGNRDGKGRYDLISPWMLRQLAGVYERGAEIRGDRNWEKGFPYCRGIDSAMRHIQQFLMGMDDEDHLAQAIWNLAAIIHFEETGRTDLDDRPDWAREDPTDASGSEPYRNKTCALVSECSAGDCSHGNQPGSGLRPEAESL